MPNWKKIALSGSNPEFSSINVDNSVSAGSFTGSLLRLDENGSGLRMTNVGAFDNNSGDFRIFANQDLVFSTNGDSNTRLTIDQTSGHANFTGAVTASAFTGDGSGLTNIATSITEEVTVSQTFTNASTASVNHLFGTKDVIVTVYDDNDDQFIPSRVNTPDTNNVNIYMDPATTGRVVVAKGGHLVSGSIHKHLMTSVTSSTITHNLQEEFPVVQVYESASREMFLPVTIKSIDQNNTQVVLSELIDCYVVIKR